MRFSKTEVKQLAKAWAIVSLAFAIVLNGGIGLDVVFLQSILMAAITVGSGFLLHELAHKYLAQRYGCRAEFRSFDQMLWIALAMAALFKVIIAAPGAVFIQGQVNNARNGRISAVGPLVNIILSLFFLIMMMVVLPFGSEFLTRLASYGLVINAWLGLFNMIPLWQFDGAKIYRWNKKIYFLEGGIALLFLIISFQL